MIDRYKNKEMAAIWTLENKYQAMLDVEIAVLKVYVKQGLVKKEELDKIVKNAKIDVNRINELELETKHDVIAFTRSLSEMLGEEAKWIHYGLTSTDVVDTSNAILIKKANDIIERDINNLKEVLRNKAKKYQNTMMIGRTHGIHADITSFGLKWALWFDELNRLQAHFCDDRREIEVGKISGAVGNFANVSPSVQDETCKELGISSSNISTQVLMRDIHARYIFNLASIATLLEQIATEIRLLSQTEIGEVEEYFSSGQKGSSAMPHKHNPITSENICGCARIMRSYIIPSLEDVSLWHERDISHSSVERIILPDALTLLDYMLQRYAKCLDNLKVNEDRMLENIFLTKGIIFSQRVLTALIDKGLTREVAYDNVQRLCNKAYSEKLFFKDLLENDEFIMKKLTKDEINQLFTYDYYLKNVSEIYKRVKI